MNHKHADIADLKDRFLEIKDRLPLDWKEVLIKEFPEYNTIRWGNHLRNVFYGYIAPDLTLMERLEGLFPKTNYVGQIKRANDILKEKGF